MGIDLPIGACLAVISLSAWLNVALRLRYPASQRLKSHYAFVMLGYDVLQLGALLYLTGGLENPFAFLLIAPVTVSASTLPPRVTVALGGLAVLVGDAAHRVPSAAALVSPFDASCCRCPYVLGIWAAVVSGILFIGFYSWRTAEEARRMAEALAAAELVLAREQKLSALDGLAAAAAHGLGTPLATIAVVAKELLRDAKHCRSALRRSRAAARAGRALPHHPRRARRHGRAARLHRLAPAASAISSRSPWRRTGWSRCRSRWRPAQRQAPRATGLRKNR